MSSSVAPEVARQNSLERVGCRLSAVVADFSAHPFAQILFVIGCVFWYLEGWSIATLTAILSVLAITLSQMVLNRQVVREAEAHRRDVALHAKLDELVLASRNARDEIAGIEALEEEEIEALRAANVSSLPTRRRATRRM